MKKKKENSEDAFDVGLFKKIAREHNLLWLDSWKLQWNVSRVVCNAALPPLDVGRIHSSASALSLVKTVLTPVAAASCQRATETQTDRSYEDKQRFAIIHK